VNGLSYAIQDDFDVLNFNLVVENYQVALGIEDKLQRKEKNMRRGQGFERGRHREKQEEFEASASTMDQLVVRIFDVDRGRWSIRGRV